MLKLKKTIFVSISNINDKRKLDRDLKNTSIEDATMLKVFENVDKIYGISRQYSGLQLRKSEQNGYYNNFLISQPKSMM